MTETGYLKEAEKFEIQAYEKPKDLNELKESHVAFLRLSPKASVRP